MFIMFEGTPGSGKTYEAIIRVVDNLKLGRTVYTNIEGTNEKMQREQIKYLSGLTDYELETQLIFVHEHELKTFFTKTKNGSFIILDEVHKYFGNRNWSSEENTAFNSWGSTHRHTGHDVLLLSQGIEKIDSHIRGLIEWTYRFKKNNMFGSVAERSYRMTAFYQDDTTKPIDRPKIKTYQKKYFGCYKSYVSGDVKELKIMPNINIFKHPIFIIIPLVLVFTFYMIFFKSSFSTGDIFGAKKTLNKYAQTSKELGTKGAAGVPVGPGVVKEEVKAASPALPSPESVKVPPVLSPGILPPVPPPVFVPVSGTVAAVEVIKKYCGFVIIGDEKKNILCKAITNPVTGALTSIE